MDADWSYASFRLELLTPIHAGSWRAGMVAQTHAFVPGHLLSYGLAAQYGGRLGGKPEHYDQALREVLASIRFSPAFLSDDKSLLYPRRNREIIERLYVRGNNHVSLQLDTRAAQDKALFEVEYIANNMDFQSTKLCGACWYKTNKLGGIPLNQWLDRLILGGEGKVGYGRVRALDWNEKADQFHGMDCLRLSKDGLTVQAGNFLPGPALSGVCNTPVQPWLGRLHDKSKGFGRRISAAAFVYMDGLCEKESAFLPHNQEMGLGCWALTT